MVIWTNHGLDRWDILRFHNPNVRVGGPRRGIPMGLLLALTYAN